MKGGVEPLKPDRAWCAEEDWNQGSSWEPARTKSPSPQTSRTALSPPRSGSRSSSRPPSNPRARKVQGSTCLG